MPTPVITNSYDISSPLTAYVDEEFSVRIPISNSPDRITVTGNWIGWGYRWIASDEELELLITPPRVLLDEIGIGIIASNDDGSRQTNIPYQFIYRVPIIADIPLQKLGRGQEGFELDIEIENNPSAVSVRGDLIGLDHQASGIGVRIFGDIESGELLKTEGEFTVTAANDTGAAIPKIGEWQIFDLPSAPRNLTASSNLNGFVTLNWNSPLDNGGYPITNYQYREGEDGEWQNTNSSTTSYLLNTVYEAGTYSFYVRAINSQGIISPISNEASVIVIRQTVPDQVTGVSTFVSGTSITLSWNEPHDGGSSITHYEYAGSRSGTTTSRSVFLSGFSGGSTYFFQVRAINGVGAGPWSTSVSAFVPIPITPPGPPRNVRRNSDGSFSWDAPFNNGGAFIQYYEWSYDFGSWTTSFPPASASNPGNHTFRVRAVNSAGAGQIASLNYFIQQTAIYPTWSSTNFNWNGPAGMELSFNLHSYVSNAVSFNLHSIGYSGPGNNFGFVTRNGSNIRVGSSRIEQPGLTIVFSITATSSTGHSTTADFLVGW